MFTQVQRKADSYSIFSSYVQQLLPYQYKDSYASPLPWKHLVGGS